MNDFKNDITSLAGTGGLSDGIDRRSFVKSALGVGFAAAVIIAHFVQPPGSGRHPGVHLGRRPRRPPRFLPRGQRQTADRGAGRRKVDQQDVAVLDRSLDTGEQQPPPPGKVAESTLSKAVDDWFPQRRHGADFLATRLTRLAASLNGGPRLPADRLAIGRTKKKGSGITRCPLEDDRSVV